MSYNARVVELLISSPSDMADALAEIQAAISDWNIAHSKISALSVVGMHWQTHAVPEAGAHPQRILDRQLVTRADLLVAVFGGRLGTPTPTAPSGTAEEIDEAIRAGKRVMLYVVASKHAAASDPAQLAALDAYLARLKQIALVLDVQTERELRQQFAVHLQQALQPFMGGPAPTSRAVLDAPDIKVLKMVADRERAEVEHVERLLKVQTETAKYHLKKLEGARLLTSESRRVNTYPGNYTKWETTYYLTQHGREELFVRGLLT